MFKNSVRGRGALTLGDLPPLTEIDPQGCPSQWWFPFSLNRRNRNSGIGNSGILKGNSEFEIAKFEFKFPIPAGI